MLYTPNIFSSVLEGFIPNLGGVKIQFLPLYRYLNRHYCDFLSGVCWFWIRFCFSTPTAKFITRAEWSQCIDCCYQFFSHFLHFYKEAKQAFLSIYCSKATFISYCNPATGSQRQHMSCSPLYFQSKTVQTRIE